jgi:GxxExxY protein
VAFLKETDGWNEHLAQCINYLKASGLRVALLINFQRPGVEYKRILPDQEALGARKG